MSFFCYGLLRFATKAQEIVEMGRNRLLAILWNRRRDIL